AEVRVDPQAGSIVSVKELDRHEDNGNLLFPGFIDAHVHAREYPRPSPSNAQAMTQWEATCRKETFRSAGEAAINGGVTLFAAMPNDPVPPDNADAYREKQRIASSSRCPVIMFAAITGHSEPWGDVPYKVYLDIALSPVSFTTWADVENALVRYRGCRVFFHAEDPETLKNFRGDGPRWKTRPAEAEIRAVEKILELTAKLGLHSHICHVSTEKAVSLICDYNRVSEDRVTCEVTPHHLFFSVREGNVFATGAKEIPASALLDCNPPLRAEDDRRFLVDALKDGVVDLLASDHAPHTMDDKRGGSPGMPHLDTLAPFSGWLMNECGFRPERVAEVLSAAPARLFRKELDLPHGAIESGYAASFTLLDTTGSTLVEGNQIKWRGPLGTLCGWSPFEGVALPARVVGTVVRGKRYVF
ncbi:MAG: amidohydrolase family protein, partial [Desulfomonilaceae bacterium]